MDIESDSSFEAEIESDEENDIGNQLGNGEWNISFIEEKNFWLNCAEKRITYEPSICPLCNIGSFEKKENIHKEILNPIFLRCNNSKCRKKTNLRYYSIFRLSHKCLLVYFTR